MKRILEILAIMAMANSGFAQNSDSLIQRPVQDMGGDGTQGLYGTPDYLSQHPNDTLFSNPGQANVQDQSGTQNANDAQSLQNQVGQTTDNSYNSANIWAGDYPNNTSNNDPFFSFNNVGDPKDIHKLGTNPEFPFLAHLSSAQQEYKAMKKHADNTALNNIIMSLGFANGIADLQASNITAAIIPGGTTGNMGAGNMQSGYYKLVGDNGFKAWKVTGDNGSYVFFLQACGNEFYPNTGKPQGTACITAPVNVTAQPMQITANGQQTQVVDKVFVYYHIRGRHHRNAYNNSEITDSHPSKPLLLSSTKRYELVPETYQVTVASQDQNVTVCPDSTANVAANINVEKTSSYTGNYPGTENKYTKVTKREYMRAQRKMRKAERKEEKVARLTKTPVDVDEEPSQKNS